MIDKEGGREAAEGGAGGSLRAGDAKEMRAVVLSSFGGLNKLRVSKKAMPEPQEGELKIRVKAWSSIAPRPLLPPGPGGVRVPRGGQCAVRGAESACAGGRALRPPSPAIPGHPRPSLRSERALRAPQPPALAPTSSTCGFPAGGAPLPVAAAGTPVSAELRAPLSRAGSGVCVRSAADAKGRKLSVVFHAAS